MAFWSKNKNEKIKPDENKTEKKKPSSKKRRIWGGIGIGAGILLVGFLIFAGIYIHDAINNPRDLFSTPTPMATRPVQTPAVTNENGETPAVTPEPTVDLHESLQNQADFSIMKDIVNILVIGVDYSEERETWNGKHAYHADVMMVVAINFEENRVDLISLPRDTYAKIPGVNGIYKLNASIDCGGGMCDEGFEKVCEAASWMLGGIPVDYYYAVTMPAVKDLTNAVGGVEYDLEMDFTMAGREYKKGLQHMDGQAVLDYLRVRKGIDASGDLNRVNRQKKMLITLFKSMKNQNLILKIPQIVESFDGQLFTNATLQQTIALSLFAYDLDAENIGMHSMGGKMKNIFGWNFCLTDQKKRVQIIEEIYGVKVEKYMEYTKEYAQYRWQSMLTEQYVETCKALQKTVENEIAADVWLPTPTPRPTPPPSGAKPTPTQEVTATPDIANGRLVGRAKAAAATAVPKAVFVPDSEAEKPSPTPEMTATQQPTETVPVTVTPSPTPSPTPAPKYDFETRMLYYEYLYALEDLEYAYEWAEREWGRFKVGKKNDFERAINTIELCNIRLKDSAIELAKAFGYRVKLLNFDVKYWLDPEFNEVLVDFR